jgi:hypothetical protein
MMRHLSLPLMRWSKAWRAAGGTRWSISSEHCYLMPTSGVPSPSGSLSASPLRRLNGTRWIERFGFLAGAAVVLIWIGALPPASEWRNSIVAVVHAALDTSRANSAFQGADDTKLLSR